jgi:dihydropteroate synthase
VSAPPRELLAGTRTLHLGAAPGERSRPLLMGVVNTNPDSFSDAGRNPGPDAQFELARELVRAGADMLDVGGESARTGRPPERPDVEIERVVPVIERIAGELDVPVSVDTYKPEVAREAIAAGASIVNDVSGLRDPELADVCARSGAALVIMHTRAAPRRRLQDPDLYDDVVAEVIEFLRERIELAESRGLDRRQLVLDPGPDFAKTPAQTIELLAHVAQLHELERPLLLAISRKDFIGALTARPPRERLGGTLAALAHGVEQGAHIFRLHDIAAARDFLAVRAALAGELAVDRGLALADELRHTPEDALGAAPAREPAEDAPGRALG